MIGSEYGFYNENDYSESDREMKDDKHLQMRNSCIWECGKYIEN